MITIAKNYLSIQEKVSAFEAKYARDPGSVKLIAVSKGRSSEEIELAFNLGQRDFAENYLQEFLDKREALKNFPMEWHFIGRIQSNKTREIAENFAWVESVDREKIASRLNEQRPKILPKLNVCIEVNISRDPNKTGVFEEEVLRLASVISGFENLKFRGLMTILHESKNAEMQRADFQKMKKIFEQVKNKGFEVDTLSMGMSGDFEEAIAAGSTQIRIGQAIFGKRPALHSPVL